MYHSPSNLRQVRSKSWRDVLLEGLTISTLTVVILWRLYAVFEPVLIGVSFGPCPISCWLGSDERRSVSHPRGKKRRAWIGVALLLPSLWYVGVIGKLSRNNVVIRHMAAQLLDVIGAQVGPMLILWWERRRLLRQGQRQETDIRRKDG